MLGKILGLSTLLMAAAGVAQAQVPAYGNGANPAGGYGANGYGASGQGQDYGNYGAPPAAPEPAYQVNTRFYFEGSLGAMMAGDSSWNTSFNNHAGLTTLGRDRVSYDLGPQMNLALGYRLAGGLRVAGEFGWGYFSSSTVHPQPAGATAPTLNGSAVSTLAGGDNTLYTMTVNAYYDLPIGDAVRPYIGAGAGWYHLDAGNIYFSDSTGANLFSQPGGSSDNGLVQAELGLTVRVDPRWSVVPSYRYEHLFASSGPALDVQIFRIGARYNF